jgi:tetratricopeptide (TPR) repeat protein
VAVVAPLLLLAHDDLVRRRPRFGIVAASLAAALAALALHLHVGHQVGMMTAWPGGSRLATAATMGPIWLRYLGESFVPVGLTVRHEVTIHGARDVLAWAAYLPLLGLGALAWAVRRTHRLPAFAWLWFVVPLLPTSQVLAPLQNLLADRYLLLAVLGPCLVAAALAAALQRPGRPAWALMALVAAAATLTPIRARAFTTSVALWADAAAKEPASARAQYQLAMALRDEGRALEAEGAFRRAVAAAGAGDDTGRMAANNLAALLAGRGRLEEAQALLRDTVARFPDDPRALGNLAEVTARLGQADEARRLFEALRARFPAYLPARRNFQRHFGQEPPR